jgi:16S rRNA (cytidine1402-2'-O)-methyltransferase
MLNNQDNTEIGRKEPEPKLYLFPLPISEGPNSREFLGKYHLDLIRRASLVLAENERTARRFISSLKLGIKIENLQIERFDKDTGQQETDAFVQLLKVKGEALLMSEAGCPAIADPGARLVAACHRNGIKVIPLIGPSSILLALMASGLSGQNFAFHGYLPVEKSECSVKIRQLENESSREKRTQLFIETPYRNAAVWDRLLENLKPETRLCLASGIGGPEEVILMKKISEWKKGKKPEWQKIPTVFLFMAE